MEGNYADLIGDSNPVTLEMNIFDSPSNNLCNESVKEIVAQQLFFLLDSMFWDLPLISPEKIQASFTDLDKFLQINHINSDPYLLEFLQKQLRHSVFDYNWRESIYKSIHKRWTYLITTYENAKSSELNAKIDELVSTYYTIISKILSMLNEELLKSHLKVSLLPNISHLEPYFKECLNELKNTTSTLKIQLKLCPGVEPPVVKRVQKLTYRKIKKPYTEWNTYSVQETIEIEKEPSCVMVPFLHRLMNYTSETKIHVVTYYAPTGWEPTRITAFVTEGNFKSANIKRTACRENKALAEVEITYPRVTREHIWCKVQLEGVLSKKSVQEFKIPEYKTIVVTVDEEGEHELPEEFLEEIQ